MAMTFNCQWPQGSRRRGKEKPDKKWILFGLPTPLSLLDPRTRIIKTVLIWLWPRYNSMEIEEFIFGESLRKRIACFFYRCSWYSVTKTGPRKQRIHEVISYIKTHKNSILQIHANTHIRAFNYEHGMTDSRIILHAIVIQAKKWGCSSFMTVPLPAEADC